MKKIALLVAILASTVSYAAPTVCRHTSAETQLETIFVLESRALMAICQRSNDPEAESRSNFESCAYDIYGLQDFSSDPSGSSSSFVSNGTNVVFQQVTDSEGGNTITLSSPYEADTIAGGYQVSISEGTLALDCN